MKSLVLYTAAVFLMISCDMGTKDGDTLYVIHAGSLTYPVKMISEAFTQEHPDVTIRTEAWGSKAGARRVADLETPADVFLSADFMVIENMLIPEHARWYISFAANEMAIVYTSGSRHEDRINADNWHEILLHPGVESGRSNPDHDPCGVRTVFTAKLAENYYNNPGLAERLLERAGNNIRPKETDLIALLESGHLDYIFLYRSVAEQHGLKYLELPPELNLGDPRLNNWYATVSTETLGARPGEKITEWGQAMVYGLTIPERSKNQAVAEKFVAFILNKDKGQRILDSLGQPPMAPAPTPYYDRLPEGLKIFAVPVID